MGVTRGSWGGSSSQQTLNDFVVLDMLKAEGKIPSQPPQAFEPGLMVDPDGRTERPSVRSLCEVLERARSSPSDPFDHECLAQNVLRRTATPAHKPYPVTNKTVDGFVRNNPEIALAGMELPILASVALRN